MNSARFKHYTLGIPELDDCHWQMFCLLNSIRHLISTNQYQEAEIKLQEFLLLSNTHSVKEREFLTRINYPYIEQHSKNSVIKYPKYNLPCGDGIRCLNVSNMISQLARHIDNDDFQIIPFYNKYLNRVESNDGKVEPLN